jgi:hypothetical protein
MNIYLNVKFKKNSAEYFGSNNRNNKQLCDHITNRVHTGQNSRSTLSPFPVNSAARTPLFIYNERGDVLNLRVIALDHERGEKNLLSVARVRSRERCRHQEKTRLALRLDEVLPLQRT